MTLEDLWQAARRWWWLLIIPAVTAVTVTALLWWAAPPRYVAESRLMIGPVTTSAAQSDAWDVTDRIIDDLPTIVSSAAFADAVAQADTQLQGGALVGAFEIIALHRSLTLRVELGSADEAGRALNAAVNVLRERGLQFWGETGGLPIVVLDIGTAAEQRSLRDLLLDAGLRGGLGLSAGWIGAIWLDYRRRTSAGIR